MLQSMPKKKLIICLSSFLAGCTSSPHAPCHQWSVDEKWHHYQDDKALPANDSLHDIIKDYERVCIT